MPGVVTEWIWPSRGSVGGLERLLVMTSCTSASRRCSASLWVTCFCACAGMMKGKASLVVVSGMVSPSRLAARCRAGSLPGLASNAYARTRRPQRDGCRAGLLSKE